MFIYRGGMKGDESIYIWISKEGDGQREREREREGGEIVRGRERNSKERTG